MRQSLVSVFQLHNETVNIWRAPNGCGRRDGPAAGRRTRRFPPASPLTRRIARAQEPPGGLHLLPGPQHLFRAKPRVSHPHALDERTSLRVSPL